MFFVFMGLVIVVLVNLSKVAKSFLLYLSLSLTLLCTFLYFLLAENGFETLFSQFSEGP